MANSPKGALNPSVPLALGALCGAGWLGLFGMLAKPDPTGALAAFGPGMQVIDMLRLHVFDDFSALLDAAALCAFQPGQSSLAVIAEIGVMWLAMVLAMVLPSWACGGFLAQAWPETKGGFRLGICAALLCLCAAGALLQICAQGLGVLSAQLRVTALPVQAVFLCAAALFHLLRHRFPGDPDVSVAGTRFSCGFRWMIRGLSRCVPMLLLMFPLGLMNVFAMAAMVAAIGLADMYRSAPAASRGRSDKVT